MQVLKNMSIAAKLSAAFAIMLGLLAILALFSFSRLQLVQAESRTISGNWLPSVQAINGLSADIVEFRIGLIVNLNATDAAQSASSAKSMEDATAAAQKSMAAYDKLISSDAERREYERFAGLWSKYQEMAKRVVSSVRDGQIDDARKLAGGEARQTFTEASTLLRQLVELNNKGADASAAHGEDVYRSAALWLLIVSLIAGGLAIVMALTLIRAITRPLAQAVSAADRVAGGDLSQPIRFEGKDETARLLEAMQRMQHSLAGTVASVREGAESVSTASAQIAQGNADLSARTEEQASSLEQTSATMEELSATVRQNADSAQQANQLAQSASEVARSGGQVVGEVVTTMRGIEDSSKRISDIISTIDGIAFQTNILALNAAVEAARAGEQGRGFAVVASEVRSLAQRSADAAKEIKSLINDSVERVQSGTQLVDRAGQTMQDIVNSVQRVADIVGEISSASVEQSAGIAQVGEAVTQLDRATQQNAALVEESAAASESLKHQAVRLLESVASFKLDGHQARARPVAAPAPKAPAHKPAAFKSATPRPAAKPVAPRKPQPAAAADGDWSSF
ncbi:methyl-accepting chemotaxis protein [Paucibacter sp. XJ19-41]|uniref:methyl-accepting chemotaxis protein n=1 Tax=Paucibacter sp. XJ19-41 TaxID=2927824 RepID=UPI0023498669|nr:methyl-accepting chemotaxis protein [Paucibacter sp. XJ19-41]MDC6168545.1 methyl-accepting chemotaxis protein [Paucibacter sp. XJ19-41]